MQLLRASSLSCHCLASGLLMAVAGNACGQSLCAVVIPAPSEIVGALRAGEIAPVISIGGQGGPDRVQFIDDGGHAVKAWYPESGLVETLETLSGQNNVFFEPTSRMKYILDVSGITEFFGCDDCCGCSYTVPGCPRCTSFGFSGWMTHRLAPTLSTERYTSFLGTSVSYVCNLTQVCPDGAPGYVVALPSGRLFAHRAFQNGDYTVEEWTSGEFRSITTPNDHVLFAGPQFARSAGLVDPVVLNINEPGDGLPPCGLMLVNGGPNAPLLPPPGYLFSSATVGIKILRLGGPHPTTSNVVYGRVGGHETDPVQTVRWVDGGAAEIIPALIDYEVAYAAADAKVLGLRRADGSPGVFIYTAARGVRSLMDVLTADYGVDTTGMSFERYLGFAGDGGMNPRAPGEIGQDELAVADTLNGQAQVWWIRMYRIPIGVEGSEARWTNASGGEWLTGTNWQGGTPPTGSDSLPIFDLPGVLTSDVTVDTDLTIAGLVVNQGGVTFDLDARTHRLTSIQTAFCDNFSSLIARDAGMNAMVTLMHGTLTTERPFRVGAGSGSSGTLLIDQGAHLDATGLADPSAARLAIGAGPSSTGSLTVRQGGRLDAIAVDIGPGTSSNAALVVDGAGSRLDSTLLYVGSRGTATGAVQNGATVNVTDLRLGMLPGSSGSMTLTGLGERVRINGGQQGVVIADQGTGMVAMSGGGGIVLNADGGGHTFLAIAKGTGGVGTLSITGPSQIAEATSLLTIAEGGNSTGSLGILGGASVDMHSATIGKGMGSTGTINVNGTGSSLLLNTPSGAGVLGLDMAHASIINVTGGARLEVGHLDARLADAATLFASGPTSSVVIGGNISIDGFVEGKPPTYTRLVAGNGATIITGSANLADAFVEVTGSNTRWTNIGAIRVLGGAMGRPTQLRVGSGSFVTTDRLEVTGPAMLDTPRITVGSGNFGPSDGITTAALAVDDVARIAGIPLHLMADSIFAPGGTWNSSLTLSGRLLPGGAVSAAGLFTIAGSFTQLAGAVLEVRLGSLAF